MKRKTAIASLFILSLSFTACANSGDSSVNSSSEQISDKSSSNQGSTFSYDFPKKEEGLSLEAFQNEISGLNSLNLRKVRFHWHSEEKLVGTYPMTMSEGGQMAEGEYVEDLVTQPKNDNSDSIIQVISGTPITKNQKFLTQYTTAVNVNGWLNYHSQKRTFKEYAQEGEGFEERFYTGPLTTWMMSWGRRPSNATMDGTYFGFNEFERIHDSNGYCTTFRWKEFYYMKGTLSGFNIGSKYYDGTYEWNATCTFEYLD